MFGIGTGELLLLLVIALLVLGPERMPKLARDLGKTVGDLRRTSDELRSEFLNADRTLNAEKLLDVASRTTSTPAAETSETGKAAEIGASTGEAAPPDAGATQAAPAAGGTGEAGAEQNEIAAPADQETTPEAATGPEADETAFDREARLARERLEDPERAKRAAEEGWKVPPEDGGNSTG